MSTGPFLTRSRAFINLYFWEFERRTEHLSEAEKMAYLRLLAHMYDRGGYVPDDEEALLSLTRLRGKRHGKRSLRLILDIPGMVHNDHGLTHKRVLEELLKRAETQHQRREAGKRGAASRWGSVEGRPGRPKRV